jgi:hypothetical protein
MIIRKIFQSQLLILPSLKFTFRDKLIELQNFLIEFEYSQFV